MSRFSPSVIELLKIAGWYEGRNILEQLELPNRVMRFPKAINIFQEFGNLRIGKVQSGKDFSACDVVIGPDNISKFSYLVDFLEKSLGSEYFLLGEACNEHIQLLTDKEGKIYMEGESFDFIAQDFDQALEILLLGVKPE